MLTTKMEQRKIEMVGMEDGGVVDLAELTMASVANQRIVAIDDGLLTTKCASLRDLDVSDNALCDLGAILCEAATPASSLVALNASLNPLYMEPSKALDSCGIQTLALTATGISWSTLRTCLKSMPALMTLDLSDNEHLERLPDDFDTFCSLTLKRFHFNACGVLESSHVISPLQSMSELEFLYLSKNPGLKTLAPFQGLEKLQFLSLAHTGLEGFEWTTVLERLKVLVHVKFGGTPCHQTSRSRLKVLGRLPQLTLLNGGEVPERERLDANILWEKEKLAAAGGGSASATQNGPATAEEMLYVTFSSTSGIASKKKIPVSPDTTISMLQDLAFQQTKIPPFRQRLWAIAPGQMVQRALLDQKAYTLDWYGFLSGHVDILVDEGE